MRTPLSSPLAFPIYGYSGAIILGAILLSREFCSAGPGVPFIDALFMSTSAVCVTGLTSIDISTVFNPLGQFILLILIQLGGLGIITYSSLILMLLRKKVSLFDHLAVGQALLHDSTFDLRLFIYHVVLYTFVIELIGAAILYFAPNGMSLFSAVFLAISAFCNTGMALFSNNLMVYADNPVVLLTVAGLIILGGISFIVMEDCFMAMRSRIRGERYKTKWTTKIVLGTTLGLILAGLIGLFLAEVLAGKAPDGQLALDAFFQSVSTRSGGFNSIDIAALSNTSILIILGLMLVGGSPGSCAGGIKTTTFAVLLAFIRATLLGRSQVELWGRAVDRPTLVKVMTLFTFVVGMIILGTFLLTLTEVDLTRQAGHGLIPMLFFETISAFGTVGLSMGITADLSSAGKIIIILIMFIGRIGPLWVLSAMHDAKSSRRYVLPENELPVG